MQAYHNQESIKIKTVIAMKADISAERLVKGHYWDETKGNGCFVGCVIRGDAHIKFETELGIPRVLARLADRIFEGQPYADAKKFSVDFLQAINPGADLSGVWYKFMHCILVDKKLGVINFTKKENIKSAIQKVADLFQRQINGEKIPVSSWQEVRKDAAAYAYADAAYAAAYADAAAAYAAYAAAAAAAAYAYAAAAYAAYAADAAAYAADAADAAAAYAAYAAAAAAYAAAADAAAYAADAAAYAHYVGMGKALIKFLKMAK